jgi:phosphohistidine swiveling domain-containing protein
MGDRNKNSKKEHYFSGGLAELLLQPTPLTYSFLKDWFTGTGSVGIAMDALGMPHKKISVPILECIAGELLVNLAVEEETLYAETIFTYKNQTGEHEQPELTVSFGKIINPIYLVNSLRILLIQSNWIAKPAAAIVTAKKLIADIPDSLTDISIQAVDDVLQKQIWPNVIAVGFLSEFYHHLALREAKHDAAQVTLSMSAQIAAKDWFFQSIADQAKVKKGELAFSEFIDRYGLRADKDYELTSPRWYEIPDILQERIKNFSEVEKVANEQIEINKKLLPLVQTAIELQILRSEAKRKTLVHIDTLRKLVREKTPGIVDISHVTKEDILSGAIPQDSLHHPGVGDTMKRVAVELSGNGTRVSQGSASGTVKHINDNDSQIPSQTIGIFPNASPEFANQYPKCVGMIFLRGGQTSHGSIVAREFGIPAIIDSTVAGIQDGMQIEINGSTGAWHVI